MYYSEICDCDCYVIIWLWWSVLWERKKKENEKRMIVIFVIVMWFFEYDGRWYGVGKRKEWKWKKEAGMKSNVWAQRMLVPVGNTDRY